jgi:APA family basic amino acid/polyamine antiporter
MGKETSGVFLRKASGLVREASMFDVLVYNFAQVGAGLGVAYMVLLIPAYYYGADMVLASVLTLIGCIFTCAVYSLLSVAMPRSGGDYVFNSRITHPAIGFALNWNFVIWELFYLGWGGGAVAFLGLSGLFATLGSVTGNPVWANYATFVSEPTGYFLIGTVVLVFFGLLMAWGTKKYFRVAAVMFVLAMASLFLCIGILGTNTQSSFAMKFNIFAKSPDAYQSVISTATDVGFTPGTPFSWYATIMALDWPAMYLLFSALSAIFAGEIKEIKKSQIFGTLGSVLISGILLIALSYLAGTVMGYDFLGASTWLYYAGSTALPLPPLVTPWYAWFVSLLTNNLIVIVLILFGFALIAAYWVGATGIYTTRSMLAWSFDRLTPGPLGYVSARFRTPVGAIVVSWIIGWIFLALYAFTPYFAVLSGFLGLLLTFMVTSFSAMIFPFRRKDMYERSPIKYEIGGIPLITICGVISLIFTGFVEYLLFVDDIAAANTPLNIGLVFGLLLLGIIYFYAARYYRKRQGIDVDLAYREIPIE